MKYKYKQSPILEAVCQFRFDAGSPWDMAVPGLIYEQIKQNFPKRKQLKRIGVSLLATEDSFSPEVQAIDEIRFLREDEKVFLALSPHMLSVHVLKPYLSWADFLPLIESGFETYSQIANPKALNRIGLRYVNKIEFGEAETGDENKIELEDYFEFRPYMGDRLNQDYYSFSLSTDQALRNGRDNLKIRLTNESARKPRQIPIILDLDYSTRQMSLDAVSNWVQEAHSAVYDAFEGCITEKLRKKLEPEK